MAAPLIVVDLFCTPLFRRCYPQGFPLWFDISPPEMGIDTISGGSLGLHIGVEAVYLVMIIQNEKGYGKAAFE